MNSVDRSALAQLTLMRIREFVREPEALFWTFFFPVLLALALGIAFGSRGQEAVAVAVEAEPGGVADTLVAQLEATGRIRARVLEPAEAAGALRRGDVALVVVPGDEVTYRYDPDRPESHAARLAADDALQRASGRTDVRSVRDEPVSDTDSRYIDFLIPGLIGLNLLGTGLWGVGYATVRMRTGKLLKRFLATPMNRGSFLLSFMLGRIIFLAAELAVLLVFARVVFDVTVRGSLLTLAIVATLGASAFTGLGLLVASRARTLEGVSGMMNLAAVPMWILSGVFFSYQNFPELLHPFIRALPLTAVVDALRAVMIDGAPLAATAGSLTVIIAWAAVAFSTALAIFRWQ